MTGAHGDGGRSAADDQTRGTDAAAAYRLVGRDAELSIVDQAFERLTHAGRAIAVSGMAGSGKSAFLAALRQRAAERNYAVLTFTGLASESAWPFAGLHQLLAPLRAAADAQTRQRLPAIMAAVGNGGEPFRVGCSVLELLTTLADRTPVVLLVDDLQRLDRESQDVLTFVAQRAEHHRILIVASARDRTAAALSSAFARVALEPLDSDSARELLRQHAPKAGRVDRELILDQAKGNPLAIVELSGTRSHRSGALHRAGLPLSARLSEAFGEGLDGLAVGTRDLLLVAAVIDDESAAEVLAAAGAFSGAPVPPEVVEEAVRAELLVVEDARVTFPHPLVRAAVLQAVSIRRRQAAYLTLAGLHGGDPVRSAWYRAQAALGYDDEAADELEAAQAVHLRRDPAAALRALERAAQLTERPAERGRRLLLAAELAFGLGQVGAFARLFVAARQNDLSELDEVRCDWLAEVFDDGHPGDAARVTELCGMARQADRAGDPDLALNLVVAAALRCWWADAGQLAPRLVTAETRRLTAAPTDPRYPAALAMAAPVRHGRRVEDLLAGLDPARAQDSQLLGMLGRAAHAVGDPVRALAFLDLATVELRAEGRLGLLAQVLTMSVADRLELGRWAGLGETAAEAERMAHESSQPLWSVSATALRASVAGLGGDLDGALRLAEKVELFADQHALADLRAQAQLARGQALLANGETGRAYGALRRLLDPGDACYHGRHKFRAVASLAEAAVNAHRTADARQLIDGLEARSASFISPSFGHQLAYARAVLADESEAEGRFRAGLAADLASWPLLRARLQLAFGSWLRRQRRPTESREPLRRAGRTFEAIGAGCWATSARRELRAAGERTGEEAPAARLDVLSAQEFQIARLVADGLSNKEVGERLYLSPRTVGSHLYRIFPKLDVTSRAQLAARLRDNGAVSTGWPALTETAG